MNAAQLLLKSMLGSIRIPKGSTPNKYRPHQGKNEMARIVKQIDRNDQSKKITTNH